MWDCLLIKTLFITHKVDLAEKLFSSQAKTCLFKVKALKNIIYLLEGFFLLLIPLSTLCWSSSVVVIRDQCDQMFE